MLEKQTQWDEKLVLLNRWLTGMFSCTHTSVQYIFHREIICGSFLTIVRSTKVRTFLFLLSPLFQHLSTNDFYWKLLIIGSFLK